MVPRGWLLASLTTAVLSASVAGAQTAGAGRESSGGAPVQALAPAPAGLAGEGLLASETDAADSPAPAGMDGGQRMGHGAGLRAGPGPRRIELSRELKLTAQQRERLAGIRERQLRKRIQSRADLALERLDLRQLLRAESPSLAAIGAQIDRIARTRAELAKSRVAGLLEMREVLSPEQRRMLRERLDGMGGWPTERGGGRYGHAVAPGRGGGID
jgi:Spy/CpxP family protein refolding chaperone